MQLERLVMDEFFWKELTRPITYVYEGLIYTYPLTSTIVILKRSGDIEQRDIHVAKDRNTFSLNVTDKSQPEIESLNKKAETCGWFPAYYMGGQTKYDVKDLTKALQVNGLPVWVTYEAKYDVEIADIPDVLYHSTPAKYLPNIQKIGLSPRGNHNDESRIYLAYKPEDAEAVSKIQWNRLSTAEKQTQGNEYAILKVVLPNDNRFRLFKDPQYLDKGCYTLSNIRHNNITVLKKVKF